MRYLVATPAPQIGRSKSSTPFAGRHCLLFAATLQLVAACDASSIPVHRAKVTPKRQYILNGVRIEERRDGKIVWTGTAERADGDLDATDLSNIILTRRNDSTGREEYTVHSPRGTLLMDPDRGTFQEVRIVTAGGATIDAGIAHYDKASDTMAAEGPLLITAPGLTATAPTGVMHLSQGSMDIAGPVRGRFSGENIPLPAQREASSSPAAAPKKSRTTP